MTSQTLNINKIFEIYTNITEDIQEVHWSCKRTENHYIINETRVLCSCFLFYFCVNTINIQNSNYSTCD